MRPRILKPGESLFSFCFLYSWLTMPPAPIPNSTIRRRLLASKIDHLGFPAMAPCPQCESSGAQCVVRKGYRSCSSCLRKNVSCGGTFSEAEFQRLETQKQRLRKQHQKERERLASLARQLLEAQEAQHSIELKLERVTARQSEMVDQEARMLGELDDIPAGPSIPESPVAIMSELDFSWALDPEVLVTGSDVSPSAPLVFDGRGDSRL